MLIVDHLHHFVVAAGIGLVQRAIYLLGAENAGLPHDVRSTNSGASTAPPLFVAMKLRRLRTWHNCKLRRNLFPSMLGRLAGDGTMSTYCGA